MPDAPTKVFVIVKRGGTFTPAVKTDREAARRLADSMGFVHGTTYDVVEYALPGAAPRRPAKPDRNEQQMGLL